MKKPVIYTIALVVASCAVLSAMAFPADHAPSISHFLQPDGTLNLGTGFSGTLNISGFDIELDSVKGVIAKPSTRQLPLAFKPSGALTGSWSAVGTGFDDECRVIAISGTDVYAGGRFTTAGGVTAKGIAKWDGVAWSSLDAGLYGGVNPICYTIAISGGELYAGGVFTMAGAIPASNIAKWDGFSWSPLAAGLNVDCYSIVYYGNGIVAGGAFEISGAFYARGIASWDGTAWAPLGDGLNNSCFTLAVAGTDLYAGGPFTEAGGAPASYIAKWNGAAWSPLGSGLSDWCNVVATSGTTVYAGGFFLTAGGVTVNRIAKWDGFNWSALGTGLNNSCWSIAFSGSDLYAGGFFTMAGFAGANRIAKWDGSAWSALGDGLDDGCYAIKLSNDVLYAGGNFSTAGGMPADNIAQYDISLPVKLVSFRGTLHREKIVLHWQTGQELNNKGFEVEKSADGVYWSTAGFVSGRGSTNREQLYSFTDHQPLIGDNFFRLKQLDHDGAYEYSPVIRLSNQASRLQAGDISPNPVSQNSITIPCRFESETDLIYSIQDNQGRVLVQQEQHVDAGTIILEIDCTALPAGIYSVRIEANGQIEQRRLVRQ